MYTTLDFIISQHKDLQLPGTPIVGFDQPLWKLGMVVKRNMGLSINLMLGNFHTQGSFLGSMGYVMKNSRLAQAFATVYGEEPVKKFLSGKSYERAMRAHGLATSVIKKMLLEQVDNDDRYAIGAAKEFFESLMEENSTPFDPKTLQDAPVVEHLMDVLEKVKN